MPTLEFKGKQFVYSHHLSVPFRELKVEADKSLPAQGQAPSLDDNLIIHGDNLEALKALLPTHAGKVDCIFIDPPYNTGNEGWCYNDNVRSPLMQEWLKKSANPVDKEDLERHDKWLCMMWPRLILLRDLLSESGALFVTIDEHEEHRIRAILDEIFGEDNYIGTAVWQKRQSPDSDEAYVTRTHDSIIIYARNIDVLERFRFERTDEADSRYSNPDNDPRGPWTSSDITRREYREHDYYPITLPSGREVYPAQGRSWSIPKDSFDKLKADNRLWFGEKGDSMPRRKRFLSEVGDGLVPTTWLTTTLAGSNGDAKKEISRIFSNTPDVFGTPKPTSLIEKILEMALDDNGIILDSFAGSGTTAHAVLEANKKDGGSRRFILVECENYANTLTAERVRRVINGYPFSGTQRDELLSEKITWSVFEKKQAHLLEKIAEMESQYAGQYDKIKKEIKEGVLTVTGERKVKDYAPGIGGSFTYCTLGEPIQIESLLTGEGMPSFEALARYVFYTATGKSLESVAKASVDGFIGETELFRIHLFYQPDSVWLRSNDAALNSEKVKTILGNNPSRKRALVFAVAKFMSQKELTAQRIEFCQLPYAIHRIMGA